jgi:hypothetical protein
MIGKMLYHYLIQETPSCVKRHPLIFYFALTFIISWGALLIMIGSSGLLRSKERLDWQLPPAILAMLGGPSIAGLQLWLLAAGFVLAGVVSRKFLQQVSSRNGHRAFWDPRRSGIQERDS